MASKKIITMDLEAYVFNQPKELVRKTHRHYVCNCPQCLLTEGLSRQKLYITDDFEKGFCQRCKTIYYGENLSINRKIQIEEFNSGTKFRIKGRFLLDRLHDFNLYLNAGTASMLREESNWLLEKAPYLDIEKFGIKFLRNQILIPFFFYDQLFYYIIRYPKPFYEGMKYYNLPIENKPLYVVGNLDSDIGIFCEGTRDAMAISTALPEVIVFAVLGSAITEYQQEMLKEYPASKYYVWMDTPELSKSICENLSDTNKTVRMFHHWTAKTWDRYNKRMNLKELKEDPEDFLVSSGAFENPSIIKSLRMELSSNSKVYIEPYPSRGKLTNTSRITIRSKLSYWS